MSEIKYRYTCNCFQCSLVFYFENKSNEIQILSCPLCKYDKLLPQTIEEVRQVNIQKNDSINVHQNMRN